MPAYTEPGLKTVVKSVFTAYAEALLTVIAF
jgi:hypothetical protein